MANGACRCLPILSGCNAFVPGFAKKAENLTAALADGRLRAYQCLRRADRT